MDTVNCTTPIVSTEGRKQRGFGMPNALIDAGGLRRLVLFQNLADADLEAVIRRFNPLALRAGQFAFHQGQASEAIYLTRSGTLRLYGGQGDGREATLAIAGPGDLLGLTNLFEGEDYPIGAVAIERAELLWVGRAVLRDLLERIPALSLSLTQIMARELRRAQAHAQLLKTQDAAGRLACVLLGFARDYGRPGEGGITIPLRLSQGDIASMIGMTRPHTNQVLRSFRRMCWISVDRYGHITMLNPTALGQRCQFGF